jgi:RNase P protein component
VGCKLFLAEHDRFRGKRAAKALLTISFGFVIKKRQSQTATKVYFNRIHHVLRELFELDQETKLAQHRLSSHSSEFGRYDEVELWRASTASVLRWI